MIMPHRPCSDEPDLENLLLDDEHMKVNSHERHHFIQAVCGCRCGCSHCHSRGKTNGTQHNTQPAVSSPVRGRSPTQKHDRTNGKRNPRPTESPQALEDRNVTSSDANSSVQGEEGLAAHQLHQHATVEIGDLGAHAQTSINHWLHQHHNPQHKYAFSSDSLDTSLLVELSTGANSLASSGLILSPPALAPDELVVFAHGGFEELMCASPRLWLGSEVGSSRNLSPPDSGDGDTGDRYPATLEMDMED